MKLYDKSNIDELANDCFICKYFKPLIKEGVGKYIKNIDCEISLLEIDNILIPIVVADKNWDDSLYVSLVSQYIKYVSHEFSQISNLLIKNILFFLFMFLEWYLKFNNVNKVVYVNHWLISTNLYPDINEEQIDKITKFLKDKYKDYAIVFKNICKEINLNLIDILKKNKYRLIAGRQIFYIDKTFVIKNKHKRKLKKDYKLLSNLFNKNFKIDKPKSLADFIKLSGFYNDLYIKKYSIYNPMYTPQNFELVSKNELFQLDIIKNNDEILTMSLLFKNNNTMTVPAVGYDMSKSIDFGLYRILIANLHLIFKKDYFLFNQSAGVGEYKMQRGAKPAIEFMAIYYKHLKLQRRIMYNLLEKIVNYIIPILCKKKLCGFVSNEF